jgi:hypothetical protein
MGVEPLELLAELALVEVELEVLLAVVPPLELVLVPGLGTQLAVSVFALTWHE